MFIAIEGIDGTGKSTVVDLVVKILTENEVPAVATRTPGGTTLGQDIRSMVLNPDSDMNGLTRLMLYMADMIHTTEEIVYPALDANFVVVTDRYKDSTRVYQVMEGGFLTVDQQILFDRGLDDVLPDPDMVFIIDAPAEVARSRVVKDQDGFGQGDAFERDTLEKWEARRQAFLELARDEDGRNVIVMDSVTLSAEEIADLIVDYILFDAV